MFISIKELHREMGIKGVSPYRETLFGLKPPLLPLGDFPE